VCLALQRFAQNSQLLLSLSWRSAVQNFTEKGKEMWKVLVEILFTALSKGSLSLHQVASNPQAECRLAETAAILKTLCCSSPCTNISVSRNNRPVHSYTSTLLAPLCQHATFRQYDWYISHQGQQNELSDVKLYNTLPSKLNFTSGNSFCCPCCWNVSVVLPEDGHLKTETCWSDTLLMKWC
jgi:hypothetical protein